MLSIDGLASGLDTTSIIDSLLALQQQKVDQLTARKQGVIAEQSAFKGIEARLFALQSTLSQLGRSVNNVTGDRVATSSRDDLLAAAAQNGAAAGTYQLKIDNLAQAHQIASQGYADDETAITTGTFTVQLGSGEATTITIDETNNTLRGLADAIEAATNDVNAAIVNTGAGDTPYRLLLTGAETGADNAITITNDLAASHQDLIRPDFSGTAIQTAADASLTMGSGPGAITITRSANEIDDLIDGVTLKLVGADPSQEITLDVSPDTDATKSAIQGFVDTYNHLMTSIDDQMRFDAESGQAAVLLGNRSAISIQDAVRSAVSGVVSQVDSRMNRLSAVGISVNDQGRLVLNNTRLDDVLAGRVDGVGETDVKRLFALDGQSDHAGIRFILGGPQTQASNPAYQVDITQAAERASVVAGDSLSNHTAINGSHNTLTIQVDGADSRTLTLTDGTYDRDELADHLQQLFDADAELSARSVTVELDGNSLRITSGLYGSSSEVTIEGGTALDRLGFDGTETDTGLDVAGMFLVDGIEEAATGSGRNLVGDSDNDHTAGLQIEVTLTSSGVQAGAEGNLTVTRGLAAQLDEVLTGMLDPVEGNLKTIADRYTQRLEDLDDDIARVDRVAQAERDSLLRQFAALESTIAQFQSTSSFLSAQLSDINSLFG